MNDNKYWSHVRLTMPITFETVGHKKISPEENAKIDEYIKNELRLNLDEIEVINAPEETDG